MIEIAEGAVFISDAHENKDRSFFFEFLKKIESGEIKTSQLFLMGDMFDLLIGGVDYLEKCYLKEIKLLNKLSKKIQIYYLEGNHDFNLKRLFPDIKIFSIKEQPVKVFYKKQNLLLSHGDLFQGSGYRFFHFFLRNKSIIFILNIIDNFFGNKFFAKYLQKIKNKKICKNIKNFDQIIKQKISLYDIGVSEIDFVLEGHYHQGIGFEFEKFKYYNFSSFACDGKYYQLKGDKITFQ